MQRGSRYEEVSLPKKVLSLIILITVLSGIILCGCADNNEQISSFPQLREPGRVISVATDIPEIKSPERILKVATTGTVQPYSYYVGDKLAGFDIEMAKRFAAWLNAGVEFRIYDFNGIMAAAQAGEADCIMSSLYYTPEREGAMDWSDPVHTVEITAMVRDQNAAKGSIVPSFSSLKTSFEKTFIRENRWKLFLSGIGTTLLITIWSILFGTLLGFLAFIA